MNARTANAPEISTLEDSPPESAAEIRKKTPRRNDLLFQINCAGILILIYGTPAVVMKLLLGYLSGWVIAVGAFACPILYSAIFIVMAGLLSRPFIPSIRPGKYPRDLRNTVYRHRRYYGVCWTTLYYCKPIYHLCLSLSPLKWLAFRLFGYSGQMDFTLYTDTWIRDLPLLELGKGAYIANRATLGTNMPLKNGKILVDRIRVGAGTLVGHLTMLAAGVEVGDDCEVESGSALGLRVKVGNGASIGGAVTLNHYSELGRDVVVGTGSCIGFRARVPDRSRLPSFTGVPDRSVFPRDGNLAEGLSEESE